MKRVHASKPLPDEMGPDPGTPIPDTNGFGDGTPMVDGDNGRVMDVFGNNSTFSKNAISEKIRELEILKERSDAKFEKDIAALKLVLSIM
jgi:hypothetical protein